MGGLLPSSLLGGCRKASREHSGWADFFKEGLASFIHLGSRGGAGGGTEEGPEAGAGGREAGAPRVRGLSALWGGGKHVLEGGEKGVRASGGGGGKRGD